MDTCAAMSINLQQNDDTIAELMERVATLELELKILKEHIQISTNTSVARASGRPSTAFQNRTPAQHNSRLAYLIKKVGQSKTLTADDLLDIPMYCNVISGVKNSGLWFQNKLVEAFNDSNVTDYTDVLRILDGM